MDGASSRGPAQHADGRFGSDDPGPPLGSRDPASRPIALGLLDPCAGKEAEIRGVEPGRRHGGRAAVDNGAKTAREGVVGRVASRAGQGGAAVDNGAKTAREGVVRRVAPEAGQGGAAVENGAKTARSAPGGIPLSLG